jgi:hypothetical protein
VEEAPTNIVSFHAPPEPKKNPYVKPEQEPKKVSVAYVLEITPPDETLKPDRKLFTVANVKTTETNNVINRLVNTPPSGTRLIGFFIVPHPYVEADVIQFAYLLSRTPLAGSNLTKNQPSENQETAKPVSDGPVEGATEGGSEHSATSGVADAVADESEAYPIP